MKKTWCAVILTALACLGGQTPPEPQPPAVPLLSTPDTIEQPAFVESYVWRVETKWVPIGKLPVEPIRLREIGGVMTQRGVVSSNRYAILLHGTNRTEVPIHSVKINDVSRTFQHVVVRKFSDGTVELAD